MRKIFATAILTIFISTTICTILFNPYRWYNGDEEKQILEKNAISEKPLWTLETEVRNTDFLDVWRSIPIEHLPVLDNWKPIPVFSNWSSVSDSEVNGNFFSSNSKKFEKEEIPELEEIIKNIRKEPDTWKPNNEEIEVFQKFLRKTEYEEIIPENIHLPDFMEHVTKLYTYNSVENGRIEFYISYNRKLLIKVYDQDFRFVTLAVYNNIDFESNDDVPEKSIVFNEATWAVIEGKLIKWQLGILQYSVDLGEEEEKISFSTYQDKIILSYGERLIAVNESSFEEILTNCTNGVFYFYEGSLYYSNRRFDLIERNLLTGEETKIDEKVYWIGGQQNVQYKKEKSVNKMSKPISVKGYFDLKGNRKEF